MIEVRIHDYKDEKAESPEKELVDFLESSRLLGSDLRYVIQAGYHERKPDLFAFASLQRGLALQTALALRINTPPKLYSLCNDIGPLCDSRCDRAETPSAAPFLSSWQAHTIREKTALNRGLRRLRKLLNTPPDWLSVENHGSESVISFLDRRQESVKLGVSRGNQLIGMCPLVLASFYEMLLRECGSSDVVLVDYCHYVDVPKIAMAVEVLNRMFFDSPARTPTIIAAALDFRGDNLSPVLI